MMPQMQQGNFGGMPNPQMQMPGMQMQGGMGNNMGGGGMQQPDGMFNANMMQQPQQMQQQPQGGFDMGQMQGGFTPNQQQQGNFGMQQQPQQQQQGQMNMMGGPQPGGFGMQQPMPDQQQFGGGLGMQQQPMLDPQQFGGGLGMQQQQPPGMMQGGGLTMQQTLNHPKAAMLTPAVAERLHAFLVEANSRFDDGAWDSMMQLTESQALAAIDELKGAYNSPHGVRNVSAYFTGIVRKTLANPAGSYGGLSTDTLNPMVRVKLEECFNMGLFDRTKFDHRAINALQRLADHEAVAAIDEMARSDMSRVRSFQAYFIGICQKYARGGA